MSDFIPPQFLSAGKLPSSGDDWRYELKYDGWRAQVHVTANGVSIFTRSGLDWTDRFPQLASDIARTVNVPCILDGEICALDKAGRPNFTKLCGLIQGKGELDFFGFDLLALGSRSTIHEPLSRRRHLVGEILSTGSPRVHLVGQFADPDALLCIVQSTGWEGIVAKRLTSPYRPGERTPEWVKLKCKRRQEFVVIGWRSDPLKGTLKSLVLGTFDSGHLTVRGSVGTGFTELQRRDLPRQFKPTHDPPSAHFGPTYTRVIPELVAEVEYLELSDHGILRQPTFLGFRHDKSPLSVVLEAAGLNVSRVGFSANAVG